MSNCIIYVKHSIYRHVDLAPFKHVYPLKYRQFSTVVLLLVLLTGCKKYTSLIVLGYEEAYIS